MGVKPFSVVSRLKRQRDCSSVTSHAHKATGGN